MLPRFVSALSIVLVATSASLATTYHVAPPPVGSDAASGSAAAPFATIQRAANIVNPGDEVVVQAGTYVGFNVGRSGAVGAPIIFRADTSAGPVIIDTHAAEPFNGSRPHARINLDTVSHIVLDGFEIVGVADQRESVGGIRMVCPAGGDFGHITLRRIHSHHNGRWGAFSGHVHHITVEECIFHDNVAEHGLYLSNSGDGHIVRRNTIYNNSSNGIHINSDASQGGDGIITGVLVEANIISNNGIGSSYIDGSGVTRTVVGGGSGINCDGVRDSAFRNNLLHNNHASGISLYRIDGLLGAGNNVVVNNTIVQGSAANTAARWCLNISDASAGNTVFNNILLNYHGFRGSIFISADSRPGFASNGNIVMDRLDPDGDGPTGNLTLAQWRAQTGQDLQSIVIPQGQWGTLFSNLSGADFHLAPGSAARDAGLGALAGQSAPPVDLEGVARPMVGVFDIGAYEFPVVPPCPADFNVDGFVNPDDLSDYVTCFFLDVQFPGTCAGSDFNGDGFRNPDDLSDFITTFFSPC
jgi:hypothetical protein